LLPATRKSKLLLQKQLLLRPWLLLQSKKAFLLTLRLTLLSTHPSTLLQKALATKRKSEISDLSRGLWDREVSQPFFY